MRQNIKIHENVTGIKVIYDILKKKIVHVEDKYKTFYLTKFSVDNIIYDEHVISCYYDHGHHPMAGTFGNGFIHMSKMFARSGMTVILSHMKDEFAHVVIFPNNQVKIFKEA